MVQNTDLPGVGYHVTQIEQARGLPEGALGLKNSTRLHTSKHKQVQEILSFHTIWLIERFAQAVEIDCAQPPFHYIPASFSFQIGTVHVRPFPDRD